MKPRILDLFCGAGGAAMGYSWAGFEVVGVDIKPQPNYPFPCHQADALEILQDLLDGKILYPAYSRTDLEHTGMGVAVTLDDFDAIHASPPCQAYSIANNIHQRTDHPKLIEPLMPLLEATGLPWVVENVPGAPIREESVVLCGLTFGLNVKRHRLFAANFPIMTHPCPPGHPGNWLLVFGHSVLERGHEIGRTAKNGPRIRRKSASTDRGREAMGIDWMTRDELSEAIPPAYTEHIGSFLKIEIERRNLEVAA